MAEKNNAVCSICGGGYHVCHSCKDSIKLQPWKIHCCSIDCYQVYQAIRGFSTGVYTKDEFKIQLKNINLSNLENYREHIKALIKDALKEEVPVEEAPVEVAPVARKRNNKANKVEVNEIVANETAENESVEAE